MAAPMKLRFDPSLPHQQEAILAVTDLFDGMPLANRSLSFSATGSLAEMNYSELGVGNLVALEHDAMVRNLHQVQQRNRIQQSLIVDALRFSVEMETGTGKTYVYLRTMFELNKLYGMKKFVIVVPSIAIREGVLHSIETMRGHFESLYDVRFEHFVYDSARLAAIRSFATSDMMQIMVINIQAFIKDAEKKDSGRGAGNVIYREFDKLNGYKPMDYISATHPVVIVDEPQKASSSVKQREAIDRLNPAVVLEYSATHKDAQHLVYRLGPIDAYEQNLVKQIEVASVTDEGSGNSAYVAFVQSDIKGRRTQVEITVGSITDPKRKKVWLKQGSDLADLSPDRPEYANGFIVETLSWAPGDEYIEFSGDITVSPDTGVGDSKDSIMRAQIETAIREHLDNELRLVPKGIKVLSLFFIDRVANYRDYDAEGNAIYGKFATWFEEIYASLIGKYSKYKGLNHPSVEKLHNGYFSTDKKNRVKDTSGTTSEDTPTYELIMRDKERLLGLDEPLRFIFSHSALREGWDNPNVFQICTLNETHSVMQKRQEIGRGLRLPVNQHGERIHDPNINRLTVVANESYRSFAQTLQREYEDDAGVRFGIIDRAVFNQIPDPARAGEKDLNGEPYRIGQSGSESIRTSLIHNGILDGDGRIQDVYNPNRLDFDEFFTARIPEAYRDANTISRVKEEINRRVFKDRIVKPARKTVQLQVNDDLLYLEEFEAFWNSIAQKTRYLVEFDTERLIAECVEKIANMPKVQPPRIKVEIANIEQTHAGVREATPHMQSWLDSQKAPILPDILTMIQSETDLTRKTVARILVESARLPEFEMNPQAYITAVTALIRGKLNEVLVDGLKYEPIDGVWHVREFRSRPAVEAIDDHRLFTPEKNPGRTVWDRFVTDSDVERRFAAHLDTDERVKYYVKLPAWFVIDTPIGKYNPDWAIMLEDQSFYLVRETKGTTNTMGLRGSEEAKINAARAHYSAIDIDYEVATSWTDVMKSLPTT